MKIIDWLHKADFHFIDIALTLIHFDWYAARLSRFSPARLSAPLPLILPAPPLQRMRGCFRELSASQAAAIFAAPAIAATKFSLSMLQALPSIDFASRFSWLYAARCCCSHFSSLRAASFADLIYFLHWLFSFHISLLIAISLLLLPLHYCFHRYFILDIFIAISRRHYNTPPYFSYWEYWFYALSRF